MSSSDAKKSAAVYLALAALVILWSFAWTYACGMRGVFIFDQSQVFDAAWRIYSGQVPYKDFLMGSAPLAPAIQAVFFHLLGVNWSAYVASAATFAALAALVVMRTATVLFGAGHRRLVLAAGLLVGSVFQSIFGTLYYEQVAFFFCLLGIWAVAESLRFTGLTRGGLHAVAGACAILSFAGKQNCGALTLAFLALLVVMGDWPRPRAIAQGLAAYVLGAALSAGLFVFWLANYSDIHRFAYYAMKVPAQIRGTSVFALRNLFLPGLLAGNGLTAVPNYSMITPWCQAFALGAASFTLFRLVLDADVRARFQVDARLRLVFVLAGALPFVHGFFQISTSQDTRNMLFFPSLALVFGYGLMQMLPLERIVRLWLTTLVALAGFFALMEGLTVSWYRREHLVFTHAPAAGRPLAIPALSSLHWLDPTYLWAPIRNPFLIDPQGLEGVYQYLTAHPQRFYLSGDSTFLYGATGVVPPSPLLYTQPEQYYHRTDIPALDAEVLASLQKNNIRLVVREKFTYFNRPDRPERPEDAFPLTTGWIDQNFQPGPIFGNYEILLRK